MLAAYIKAPFTVEFREENHRPLLDSEVRLTVNACGVCGHDLILMRYAATELQQFGHEVVGTVKETGRLVTNVSVGDRVVLESGTYDRFSDNARNGRVDLDNKGPNFWVKGDDNMGFAHEMIAPCECCVLVPNNVTDEQAVLSEPLGVALDMVKAADIKLMNDVLVMGLGPIGLMAARIARVMGARRVYATELSCCEARIALAKEWGVDEVICPDKQDVTKYPFENGGVDRVLVTAPPAVLPGALETLRVGGILSFIGIAYGEASKITIDANLIHFNKLQVRASHASPALYFPECLALIAEGAVDTRALITHRFRLEDLRQAVIDFDNDKQHGIKAVMYND